MSKDRLPGVALSLKFMFMVSSVLVLLKIISLLDIYCGIGMDKIRYVEI
jgi:hypothetical protein